MRNPLALRGAPLPWPVVASMLTGFGPMMMGDPGVEDDEEILGGAFDAADDLDASLGAMDPDDDYSLGAHGSATAGNIARLENKIASAKGELSAETNPRKRKSLARKIARLEERLSNARGTYTRKLDKAVSKGKMSPQVAAALAASAGVAAGGLGAMMMMRPEVAGGPGIPAPASGPAMQTYPQLDYPIGGFTGRVAPSQAINVINRSASAGEEIRLPFQLQGSSIVRVTFPPSAGPFPQVANLALVTPLIPYAGFQCLSLDTIIQVLPDPQALVTGVATFCGVNGEKNLLYATEPLEFAGQSGVQVGRTIAGLRENQVIQPVNQVQAFLTVQQEVAHANALELVVKAAIVVRSIFDPAVRR